MATIEVNYCGALKTEVKHVFSGKHLHTEAPLDNGGTGGEFSPTDLIVTALGTCILTIMAKAIESRGGEFLNTRIQITKVMSAEPRRIAEIVLDFYFSRTYTEKEKMLLEHAVDHCPVALSLHPDIVKKVHFYFPD